jgi:hypothetical protein
MKLQVNDGKRWNQVISFDQAELLEVQSLAESLGELAASIEHSVSWRVLNDLEAVAWIWTYAGGWTACSNPGSR